MSHVLAFDIEIARHELYERAERTDYHLRHGISWSTIEAHAGVLTVIPVLFYTGGKFDFTDYEGEQAVVIEAFEEDGETTLDLVAWPVDRPAQVASMFGRAPLVGMWQVYNPASYIFDEPLQVHRTPLDWLKADGGGCAIVTPRLAAQVLNDLPGRIAGHDPAHALELGRLLESIVDLSRIVAPMRRAA
jgi:hypothetical protein